MRLIDYWFNGGRVFRIHHNVRDKKVTLKEIIYHRNPNNFFEILGEEEQDVLYCTNLEYDKIFFGKDLNKVNCMLLKLKPGSGSESGEDISISRYLCVADEQQIFFEMKNDDEDQDSDTILRIRSKFGNSGCALPVIVGENYHYIIESRHLFRIRNQDFHHERDLGNNLENLYHLFWKKRRLEMIEDDWIESDRQLSDEEKRDFQEELEKARQWHAKFQRI